MTTLHAEQRVHVLAHNRSMQLGGLQAVPLDSIHFVGPLPICGCRSRQGSLDREAEHRSG